MAPIAYGGYLWLLSATGQVYRYSPYASQPTPLYTLGTGFGRCAFGIKKVSGRGDLPEGEPWLLTANRTTVTGYGLMSRKRKDIVALPDGEEILFDSLENYVTVEADATRVHFLSRGVSGTRQSSVDFHDGRVQQLPLPSDSVAGPFCSGDAVFVYSETYLYSFSDAGMRKEAFPAGFRAWTKHAVRDLKPTLGRTPFILCARAVYIPGIYAGRNAFLLQQLKGAGEAAVIPLPEEATYTADAAGHPVLSLSGRVATLIGPALSDIKNDEQLSPRRPAFVGGSVVAGVAETAGRERLRFFAGDATLDFPLLQLPRYHEPLDFYALGSAIVMTYLTDSEQLGIASWHVG